MALKPFSSVLKSRAISARKRSAPVIKNAEILAAIALIQSSALSHAERLSLVRTVKSLAKRLRLADRRAVRATVRHGVLASRVRAAAFFTDDRDLDQHLAYLLNRHQPGQGNMYSRAHGKRVAAKLGREHYVRMGKLGAAARWHKPKPE